MFLNFISDPHLTPHIPESRKDNYPETILTKYISSLLTRTLRVLFCLSHRCFDCSSNVGHCTSLSNHLYVSTPVLLFDIEYDGENK